MIRKKKIYARPRKMYEKSRIEEENKLVEKYGLKNKREIWKTLAKVNYFRTRAKALAQSPPQEQEVLFNKLKYIGLNVSSISEVLALQVEDLLKRRLPTIVAAKGFANTPKQARQMIVHKRLLVNGNAVNIPSYLVPVSFEHSITVKKGKAKEVVAKVEPTENTENNMGESN